MQTPLNAYEFLPGFFKLSEGAWGLSLMSMSALPYLFLVLTSLLLILASLLSIHGPTRGVLWLKGGIMIGGILLFLGHGVACLSACLSLELDPAISVAIGIFPLLGLLILGASLLLTTHNVYDAAC